MSTFRCLSLASLFVLGCAEASYPMVISTSTEPVGANCPNGGVRIDVGEDVNGNGGVDSDEVTSTQYVCNGTAGGNGGTGDVVDIRTEPAGANCEAGGTRIDVGPDDNGNGTLDPEEIVSTDYVCNGTDGAGGGGGGAVVVEAYAGTSIVIADNAQATLQTATIDAPTSGTVFAIASADAYCGTNSSTAQCDTGTPASDVCITVTDDSGANACDFTNNNSTFAHLDADETTPMTRTSVFTVAAGQHTYYLRGATTDGASSGEAAMFRRSLTLVFVAD